MTLALWPDFLYKKKSRTMKSTAQVVKYKHAKTYIFTARLYYIRELLSIQTSIRNGHHDPL